MTTLWFALAAALGNMAGALAVVRSLRRELRLIDACLAFGAGFMLAVAVLGVLPEVLREGEEGALYVLAGYLAVHLAQHVFTPHFHFGEETHRVSPSAGVSALLGLTLHTFFDGSLPKAVVALLSAPDQRLTDAELDEIARHIERARRGER